jgi:hypothetical protein
MATLNLEQNITYQEVMKLLPDKELQQQIKIYILENFLPYSIETPEELENAFANEINNIVAEIAKQTGKSTTEIESELGMDDIFVDNMETEEKSLDQLEKEYLSVVPEANREDIKEKMEIKKKETEGNPEKYREALIRWTKVYVGTEYAPLRDFFKQYQLTERLTIKEYENKYGETEAQEEEKANQFLKLLNAFADEEHQYKTLMEAMTAYNVDPIDRGMIEGFLSLPVDRRYIAIKNLDKESRSEYPVIRLVVDDAVVELNFDDYDFDRQWLGRIKDS